MRTKQPAIYILGNENLTLYIGVTSNPIQRIYQHKQSLIPGFTKQYKLPKLLYYEILESMEQAINREKQLKRWHRDWKLNLIKTKNPTLKDLYPDLIDAETSSV